MTVGVYRDMWVTEVRGVGRRRHRSLKGVVRDFEGGPTSREGIVGEGP